MSYQQPPNQPPYAPPPGGWPPPPQAPHQPSPSPTDSHNPTYLNPHFSPSQAASAIKTSALSQAKKTLAILAHRPTLHPTSSNSSSSQQGVIYTQSTSPVPNAYSAPGTPQGQPTWAPQQSPSYPPQHQPQHYSPQPPSQQQWGGQGQMGQGTIPPPHPPHQTHPQYSPPAPVQSPAGGPPPAYQAPPPQQQPGFPQQPNYDSKPPLPAPTVTQYPSPALPQNAGAGPAPFGPPPTQQHQHQQPQQAVWEWGMLVDINTEPPRANEKLRNLVEAIAEYVIESDTPSSNGLEEQAPIPVLGPAGMARVYERVRGYNSTYADFFSAAVRKPNRLTEFYDILGLQYLLIPHNSGDPSRAPSPGLTLNGFERFILLQILLFPDLSAQLLTSLLTSPTRPLKDPTTGQQYPLSGPPRTSLPAQPHAATFAKFGTIWQKTVNTPPEANDVDSFIDKLNHRISTLTRDLEFHQTEAKNSRGEAGVLRDELGGAKKILAERDAALREMRERVEKAESERQATLGNTENELKRLTEALRSRDEEVIKLRRSADEVQHLSSLLQQRDTDLTRHTSDLKTLQTRFSDLEIAHRTALADLNAAQSNSHHLASQLASKERELSDLTHARSIREAELSGLLTKSRDLEREVAKARSAREESENAEGRLRKERTDLVQELAEVKRELSRKDAEMHKLRSERALGGAATSSSGGGGIAGLFGFGGGNEAEKSSPPGSKAASPAPYQRREYGRGTPGQGERRPTMASDVGDERDGRRPSNVSAVGGGRGRGALPYPEDP